MRQPHSILFIEPDDSLDMYAYYLRESGFTVQTADTTDDGLRRASDADVIVTWIRVPGNEVELVGRLRNTDATRLTPVIVLTACGSEIEQWRALVASAPELPQPSRVLTAEEARGAVQNANADMRRGVPSLDGDVMFASTTPEDGDIVVRKEIRRETPVYVLHIAPGADQYQFLRRDGATAQGVVEHV